MAKSSTYDASSISVLEGLEAVRKRPGMYIGSVSRKGLNHLIYEIVDNAVDEHLAGYCDRIEVYLEKDGSAVVEDNGRGIPVGMHEKGMPAERLVFTTLHAGGKFDDSSYKTSGGLHGVGSSVVNALSTWLDVEVMLGGQVVEKASARVIFSDCPKNHPYTEGLMTSIPRLNAIDKKIEPIPGVVPHPLDLPKGCKFAPRCKYCTQKCIDEEPDLQDMGDGQLIRCFYPEKEVRCSEEHKKITVNQ